MERLKVTKNLNLFSFSVHSVQSRRWKIWILDLERWIQKQKQTSPREAEQGQQNFQCKDETQKIQIIGRIYRVGRGIRGSDLVISKGSRPAAGTVEISTKQSVQWDQHSTHR